MRHWPKFPRPPPSLRNLGRTKLGHLVCFETPSLPLKFGTYISFFYEFSMIINSERRIETVIQLSNFWPKSSKFLLAQFAPSWEQRESLNYSKIHKTWAWWAKIYCIFLWQRLSDPLPPRVFVPIKISKKLGLRPDPLPPFGPMSQILLFFFEGIPYSNWCME